MIQVDIPLGKIAKKLAKVTDEIVLYGREGGGLYLLAMDPSQSLLICIDAGISLDEDIRAGLSTKELRETTKGIRYTLDYDQGAWRVVYETTSGLRVKKKLSGLEPTIPVEEVIKLGADAKEWATVDYVSLSQALSEIEGDSVKLVFTQGKPGKLSLVSSEPGKEVEVEVSVSEVERSFEVRVDPKLLEGAIEALEPLTRTFRIGLTEKGILVIKPSTSKDETKALIAPLAE